MNKRSKTAVWLPIVATLLFCVLAILSGRLQKQEAIGNVVSEQMTFPNGTDVSLSAGDAYGVVESEGPGFNLPAGKYRIHWVAENDGDALLHVLCDNGTAIEPSTFVLPAGEGEGDIELTLPESCENVQLKFEFAAGESLSIEDIRIYLPAYADDEFTLVFFALALSVLWVLYATGRMKPDDACILLAIGIAVLIASGPALKETLNIGHDTEWHLARIENLASGLREGQLPVRLGGDSYNGYGALTSIFYPDFFLYPFALMRLCGASLIYVGNVLSIAINLASALSMYVAAKRLFGHRGAAACASIGYTLAMYRLSDVFTRYAVGEAIAMAILPMFIWALWEVVCGDQRRWAALSLTAAGIALCHVISTMLCALLAVLFGLIHICGIVKEKRILPILKAAGLCALLVAFQYVPFLTYASEGIGAADLAWHLIYNTIEPAQLLTLGRGTIVKPKNLRLLSFSAGLDLWLIIGAGLALVAILRGRRRDENERKALTFIAGGVLFAVASTDFFPWSYVALIDHGLMDYMQFTWRLLMLAVVLLALAAGYGVARFFEEKPEYGVLLTLCLASALALPTLTTETQSDLYLRYGETYPPYMYGTEYTMEGTNFDYTLDKNPHVEQGEISLTAYAKQGTQIEMQVEAQTDGVISVPLFGYDGYCAQADGQELETGLDENKRLTVVVPAGTKGEVKLWYAGKRWWRISDAVSLLTALALIAARIQHRRKAQKA